MSDKLRTRRNTRPLGVVVLVVGLLAAGTLWVVAGSRRDAAIENLARAPIGCDTTLDFAQPGEYLIFVETAGRLDDVRGDCDADGDFVISTQRPPVEITLIDPDGDPLEFESRRDDVTYSSAGYVGRSILSVEVTEAADHVLRAESSESGTFAVVVGRDPNRGVMLLRIVALVTALAALAIGLVLIIRGGRREPVAVGPWTAAQPTAPTWVQHPGQPPYQAPTQPPYVQPGAPGLSGSGSPPPATGVGTSAAPTRPPTLPTYGAGAPAAWPPMTPDGGNVSPPSPGGPWGLQAPPPGSPFAPPQGSPSATPDDVDRVPSDARRSSEEPATNERATDDAGASTTPRTGDPDDSSDASWAPQPGEGVPPTLSERRWDTARDD
jgi:hypothetical protein